MTACSHCHTCGTALRSVLDGEAWCPTCETYRRYISHGWGRSRFNDDSPCPNRPPVAIKESTP